MIEKILISYLNTALSTPVYAEIPSNSTNEFIVMQKIGGGVTNKVNAATISFECYSTSLQKAAELNERLQGALIENNISSSISSAKLGGESSNIDLENKKYRYESIINFYYYK